MLRYTSCSVPSEFRVVIAARMLEGFLPPRRGSEASGMMALRVPEAEAFTTTEAGEKSTESGAEPSAKPISNRAEAVRGVAALRLRPTSPGPVPDRVQTAVTLNPRLDEAVGPAARGVFAALHPRLARRKDASIGSLLDMGGSPSCLMVRLFVRRK
jgi:hypothetical protein